MAKGLNLYTALDGAGFIFDPADRVAVLTNLYNDVAAAYASGARPVSDGDKRILITGCPIGGVMNKTVKTIEENGGHKGRVSACRYRSGRHYDGHRQALS